MNNYEHNQDRGTKKWTTMMLPEHKEQLKGMWKRKSCRSKPIFDEQQLELFHATILVAYREGTNVLVFHCKQEKYMDEDVLKISGKIKEISSTQKHIKVDNTWISLTDVLDIQII